MSEKRGLDEKKLKKFRNSKKNQASTQMRDRLTRFSICVSFAMFVASILRIRTSLNPDPNIEGMNGLTEYAGLIITPFVIMTFSVGLWSDFFGCSAAVKEQNVEYARRNSYRGGSSSGRASDLDANNGGRDSNLSASGRKSDLGTKKQSSSSGSKYGCVVEKNAKARDSNLGATSQEGANSSMSTITLVSSPSASSPYVTERPEVP
jgi:hypothetical protein